MTTRSLRGALALCALPLALAAPAAGAHASALTMTGAKLANLNRATDLGAADASQTVDVGFGLADPHAAAEQRLLQAISTPGSPEHGQFLTPASFARRFGVDDATFARVQSWLKDAGLKLETSSAAHNYVEARGTVGQVDALLGTAIHDYSAKGVDFFANSHAPSVPSDLDLMTIVGLNSLQHPTTPLAHRAAGGGSVQPGELTPQDMWSIYDQPANNLGDGQSIAVIGEGETSTTVKALATFEDHHKLPHVPAVVTRAPSVGDYSDNGGNIEWELDTQASTGMAPNVKQLHLYFGQHLIDPDVESAFTAWVDDPKGPKQANASFGECETTPANPVLESPYLGQFNNDGDYHAMFGSDAPDALEPVAEQTLRQAALEGRTLFASTGDTGSSCPVLVLGPAGAGNGVANQGAPIVNYPAASQYAVAVGGSVLYGDGGTPAQRGLEYPWPFTGGGQSFFIAAPSWQQGVANVNRPCLADSDGGTTNTGAICRGVPDVASESGDIATSSYTIYSPELDGDSSEGGTSLSSPLWVGMWARMQAASVKGTGFADPVIYKTASDATKYARDFYDLQTGTNGAYTAGAGWDYVSGWGVPDVTNLMKDVDGRTAPVKPSGK